jgi:Protein of unknown function (DUF3099)
VTHPQRHPAAGSDPVLITDAARSYEEDLKARKRRYAIMMGMRVPCMVLAAVFYQTPWLAVTLLVLSIPLPWMAVLIANDRRPPKREEVSRYVPDRRSLEARPHPAMDAPPGGGVVVDGMVVDGPRDGAIIDEDGPTIRDASHRDSTVRDDAGRDARRAG